jgi:hypothetical protein
MRVAVQLNRDPAGTQGLKQFQASGLSLERVARPRSRITTCVDDADNGGDSGTVVLTCPFTKWESSSQLKLTYSDNIREYSGNGGWCIWEVQIDNQSCAGPTPNIRASQYHDNGINGGAPDNLHQSVSVVGVCDRVGSGQLLSGAHTARVVINANADCHTGWNATSTLIIEEL